MAESRQQLIQGSSFFQRQKEKLGSFMAKRSTITGAAFKKGTSQESSDKIEKRVGNNEKKITFLKKIIKTRKDNVDKKFGTQNTLLSTLQSIASSVDSIRDTLIQRQESGEEGSDDRRTRAEQDEFDKREKDLEKKNRFEGLKSVGSKVLQPVMSLWDRIWNFIKTLFFGKILLNLLKWMADPANQKKIKSFGRFIKNFWPALLTGALLFMTGLGGMITNMTVAIALWIPKMLAAIAGLKAKALIGGAGMMGFGRKALSAFGATRRFNEGGVVEGPSGVDQVPSMLTEGESVLQVGARERMMNTLGVDPLSFNVGPKANRPSFSGGKSFFNNGGIVTNQHAQVQYNPKTNQREVVSGNIDIDQADKISDRISLEILKNDAIKSHGFHSVEHKEAQKQIMVLEGTPAEAIIIEDDGQPIRIKSYSTFDGVTSVESDKDYKNRLSREKFNRNVGGVADFMTFGMFDFDQQNRKGAPKDWGINRIAGGIADYLTLGLTDFDKRGAGIAQFNPISGGKDKAWSTMKELREEKEKKTDLTLSQDQETKSSEGVSRTIDRTNDTVEVITAQQSANNNLPLDPGGSGNEIPSFDVGVTRDVSKIRTLGIMLL